MSDEAGTLRIDLWLFYARLVKTRSLASRLCAGGLVAVNNVSFEVRSGEILAVISAPDLDGALAWGRKLARATTLPIEVRPFQSESGR